MILSRVLLFFPQVHNPSWLHHQSYIMPPTVSIFLKLPALLPVSLRRPHSSLFQGAVLTSGMDHSMSIHPSSMMGPLTQQLNHLSIGSSGTVSRTPSVMRLLHINSSFTPFSSVVFLLQYMAANTSMQGTYIPQYTQVPATNISVEVMVSFLSRWKPLMYMNCQPSYIFAAVLPGKCRPTARCHRDAHRTHNLLLPA